MEIYLWRAVVSLVIIFLLWRSLFGLPRLVATGRSDVRDRSIETLAIAVNCKDSITAEHVHRVRLGADALGRLMGCSRGELQALREGALLHDVGKIGVRDAVLLKPGRLTPEEFAEMQMHTIIGYRMVSRLQFPYPLAQLIRSHHERWDGGGYPDGLKGAEIPVIARILSVVDCFDAWQNARPYKPAFSREESKRLLLEGRGTQFDPAVVDCFLAHADELARAAEAVSGEFQYLAAEPLPPTASACAPAAGFAVEGGCAS